VDVTDFSSNKCKYNLNISQNNNMVKIISVVSKPTARRYYNLLKDNATTNVICTSPINTYTGITLVTKITGTNGVSMTTKPSLYASLPTINVGPSTPHNLNSSELLSYLDQSTMDITGMDVTKFNNDNILPDGSYTLCFVAKQYNAGTWFDVSDVNLGCANFSVITDPIKFTVIYTPPVVTNFEDYKSKLTVTATSQSEHPQSRIGLRMKSSSVEISTITSNPTVYNIVPNTPLILNASDYSWLFDRTSVNVTGIPNNQFQVDANLPDGFYSLCFEAYDPQNILVSNTGVGCANINVVNTTATKINNGQTPFNEPPIIILPSCGSTAQVTFPQNVVLSWLPSSSAVALGKLSPQSYIIRVVEMLNDKQDPYDAIRTATTPFFFEKTVIGNSYIYGPADPKLEDGRRYAFVIIIDQDRETYRNHGQSDVCWFQYGMPLVDSADKIITPKGSNIFVKKTIPNKLSIKLLSPESNVQLKPDVNKKGNKYYTFKWDGPLKKYVDEKYQIRIVEYKDTSLAVEKAIYNRQVS